MAKRCLLFTSTAAALLVAAADGSSVCPLPWTKTNPTCPFGWSRKPFDVTVPNNGVTGNWWIIDIISVLYGYLIFILIVVCIVETAVVAHSRRGIPSRNAAFLVFITVIALINELVFKPILQQPRPDKSCNTTCGFPSGHSTFAIGWWTLMFLDGLFRVRPKVPFSSEAAHRWAKATKGKDLRFWKDWRYYLCLDIRSFSFLPLSKDDTLSHMDFLEHFLHWTWFLVPVPYSRVLLNDHTHFQIWAGSCIGMVEALFWVALMRLVVLPRTNHLLGERIAGIFIHNYALPHFEVYSRCLCQLAEYELELASSAEQDTLVDVSTSITKARTERLETLARMEGELTWYIKNTSIDSLEQLGVPLQNKLYNQIEKEDFEMLLQKVERFSQQIGRSGDAIELTGAPVA